MFDSLDPSPFIEKDLDSKAEEYIVDSFRELPPGTARTLVVHLDKPPTLPEQEKALGDAVREHFSRQARRLQRQLRTLIRRGVVSLGIGFGFLALVFAISQSVGQGGSALAQLLHQGLLIVGWVAMWRPLEIFLYDWWPIVGECRIYDRLSDIQVQIAPGRKAP